MFSSHRSQVTLPVCGVVKQRSSRAPRSRERALVLDAEVLRRELGVGDHDVPHSCVDGGVDDGEDLIAREVAGGEDHPVAGDHRQYVTHRGEDAAVLVDDRDGLDLDALLPHLELELDPYGLLAGALALARLVDGIHRRHPHRPRTLSRRHLDRQRIDPSDGPVERERAEDVDGGNGRADHARALGGGAVVRLEDEAVHPSRSNSRASEMSSIRRSTTSGEMCMWVS